MKNFTRMGYRLGNASLEIRLVYTLFLIIALIGFTSSAIYQGYMIGWDVTKIALHYNGDLTGMSFPKTFAGMLATTHSHSFVMALLFITIAHLYIACATSAKQKRLFIVIGACGIIGDLLFPWGIRYISPLLSWGLLLSWLCQWVAYGVFIIAAMREMWWNSPQQ